jgi:hypothetical protein
LLRGLSVLFLGFFLLYIWVLEEELVVVELIEVDDGLLTIYVFPILRHFGHLFVTVGDHPDESGSEIVKASRRIWTIDRELLGARFGRFC